MRDDLQSGDEIRTLVEKYEPKKGEPLYTAVMDVIARANWKRLEDEVIKAGGWN